jgi:glycosyltransferase involved in cell wall biosynthesis
MAGQLRDVAIVAVTYKRQELLVTLFESILLLDRSPMRVYVVDNENSDATREIVEVYNRLVADGLTAVPWESGVHEEPFCYLPQSENIGGAGGFAAGVEAAYTEGAQWFWLMDDDVEVMPDALSKLAKWTGRFDCIQGSRLDFDGGAFYWQYQFDERLGVYNMFASADLGPAGFKPANAVCFEGGLFSRDVVDAIGVPDARFFLYWDDCIYGYLASKRFDCAVVADVILRRTRDVANMQAAAGRQLNSSSDLTRYHLMKNRGHMAHYLKEEGDYFAPTFAVGTAICVAKEFVRLVCVDRANFKSGMKALVRGWKEARAVMRDDGWKPYSEVCNVQAQRKAVGK